MSEFELALKGAIKAKIAEMKKDGIVGMALGNLKAVVKPPAGNLKGAPAGTNAAWAYDEIFGEVAGVVTTKGFEIY